MCRACANHSERDSLSLPAGWPGAARRNGRLDSSVFTRSAALFVRSALGFKPELGRCDQGDRAPPPRLAERLRAPEEGPLFLYFSFTVWEMGDSVHSPGSTGCERFSKSQAVGLLPINGRINIAILRAVPSALWGRRKKTGLTPT